MSLLGRKIIDQFKTSLPRLTLPVPPYGSGKYWEKVYNTLGVNDVYEWGDLTMEDLEIVRYKKQFQDGIRDLYGDSVFLEDASKSTSIDSSSMVEEDFEKVIGVSLVAKVNDCNGNDIDNHDENDNPAKSKSSILILGCGNSNLGEEIYSYYDKGYATHQSMNANADTTNANTNSNTNTNAQQQASASGMNINIIQCDISPSVVSTMSERYAHLPNMSIVQADACYPPSKNTNVNVNVNVNAKSNDKNEKKPSHSQSQSQSQPSPFPFRNQSMDAVVDKGLMDALFCSDKKLMPRVMMNIHQSLKCGSVFMFFSFSRPEYLLKETVVRDTIWETDMNINGNDDNDNDDNDDDNERNSASNVNNDKDKARDRVLDLWSQVDVCELDTIFMYRFVKKINSDIQIDFVEKNGRMGMGTELIGAELIGAKSMPSMHTRRKIKR